MEILTSPVAPRPISSRHTTVVAERKLSKQTKMAMMSQFLGFMLDAYDMALVLAKQEVPDSVCRAYGAGTLEFGIDYIIPKPFDPRVLVWTATAVAKAATDSGMAQNPVNIADYREQLEKRLGMAHVERELVMVGS